MQLKLVKARDKVTEEGLVVAAAAVIDSYQSISEDHDVGRGLKSRRISSLRLDLGERLCPC